MKIVVLLARILLGLMFLFFGLNGFLHFLPSPPIPGPAGAFIGAMFESNYSAFIFAVQTICGVLLLANEFVPLTLLVLAAVIANILVFHLSMAPSGIGLGLFATILWLVVAYSVRTSFEPLFVRKAPVR